MHRENSALQWRSTSLPYTKKSSSSMVKSLKFSQHDELPTSISSIQEQGKTIELKS